MEQVSHYVLSFMPLCWVVFGITFIWARKSEPAKVRTKR